jgi:uncharacterized membrane protein (DUF485 family)
MLHEPAASSGPDPASDYKAKLGVKMFFFYALIYAIFVAINLIKPTAMETEVVLGLNLAVVYGMGLIIFALVLALIYNHFCGRREHQLAQQHNQSGRHP